MLPSSGMKEGMFSPPAQPAVPAIEKITRRDAIAPPPEVDGTLMILRRHGDYQKDSTQENPGSLKKSWEEMFAKESLEQLRAMIEAIPEVERSSVDFLSVASPTEVFGGQRSMETAQIEIGNVERLMAEYGIPTTNFLNTHENIRTDIKNARTAEHKKDGAQPRASADIEHPRALHDSPEFIEPILDSVLSEEQRAGATYEEKLNFLYRDGKVAQRFWQLYEDDEFAERRKQLGAEGPLEMANRFAHHLDVLNRFARKYHAKHPGRRLIILGASHYDTLTTYVKNHVAGMDQKTYLPVDFGGGIGISIRPDGTATSTIAGQEFPITFQTTGSRI